MVCSPLSCWFQPVLPNELRILTKPISRVSSRRKWVWPSMMNCLDSAPARSAAMSGAAASASVTSKRRPNTWFIATNEAAMPAAVWKKRRRDKPCRRASRPLNSLSRASTSRCSAVCGTGMYSSLDTIWVGTGEANDAVSAGCSSRSCSSVKNFTINLPYWWLRRVPSQQYTEGRDRRCGIDPNRPGQHRETGIHIGTKLSKCDFKTANSRFNCCDPPLHRRQPIVDRCQSVFVTGELLGSSDSLLLGGPGCLEGRVGFGQHDRHRAITLARGRRDFDVQ